MVPWLTWCIEASAFYEYNNKSPGGAVTASTYDSGTPMVLTLWQGCGGVWCACPLPFSEGSPVFVEVGALVGVVFVVLRGTA